MGSILAPATITQMREYIQAFERADVTIDAIINPILDSTVPRKVEDSWTSDMKNSSATLSKGLPGLMQEVEKVTAFLDKAPGPFKKLVLEQQHHLKALADKVSKVPTLLKNTAEIEYLALRLRNATADNSLYSLDLVTKSIVALAENNQDYTLSQKSAVLSLSFSSISALENALKTTIITLHQLLNAEGSFKQPDAQKILDELPSQLRNALHGKVWELSGKHNGHEWGKIHMWDNLAISKRALDAIIEKEWPGLLEQLNRSKNEKITHKDNLSVSTTPGVSAVAQPESTTPTADVAAAKQITKTQVVEDKDKEVEGGYVYLAYKTVVNSVSNLL